MHSNSWYGFDVGVVSIDLSDKQYSRIPTPFSFLLYAFQIKLSHIPFIVDTGASVCITPEISDFKPGTYRSSKIQSR
jgi:hypothetical protein